jgi:hypothetical protein
MRVWTSKLVSRTARCTGLQHRPGDTIQAASAFVRSRCGFLAMPSLSVFHCIDDPGNAMLTTSAVGPQIRLSQDIKNFRAVQMYVIGGSSWPHLHFPFDPLRAQVTSSSVDCKPLETGPWSTCAKVVLHKVQTSQSHYWFEHWSPRDIRTDVLVRRELPACFPRIGGT